MTGNIGKLKVGDRILYQLYHGGGICNCEVVKVNKVFITDNTGQEWLVRRGTSRRGCGYQSAFHRVYAYPATAENLAEAKETNDYVALERRRNLLINEIAECRLRDLPTDALETLAATIRDAASKAVTP